MVKRRSFQGISPVGISHIAEQSGRLTKDNSACLGHGTFVHEPFAACVQRKERRTAPGSVRSAAKTHLVYKVDVFFSLSTQFTYPDLQGRLSDKYGEITQEVNKIKDEPVYVKYTSDYSKWQTDTDTVTQACNTVILSKCSYHSTSPVVISYIDGKNSKVETLEVNSDF